MMMYKHQVDECIKRTRDELNVARKYHMTEEIDYLQRRLDSLYKLRDKAPAAKIGVGHELETV